MTAIRRLIGRYGEMASDVAWSGLGDFLSLAVNMLSFILLGSTLEVETYGGYIGAYGVIAPLGALTWSGISLLILQRIIREGDSPKVVAARTFTLTISQGLLATVVAVWIGSEVISTIDVSTIAMMAVSELVLFPIAQAAATLVQAVKGFAAAARLRILMPAVRLGALLIPYFLGILTIRTLAFSWIVGFAITAAASVFFVLPTIGIRFGFGRPSPEYLRGNLELSLPVTASTLQTNGDKAVMNYYGLEADAGLYGAAFRIIMLSQMPIKTMNQALFQRFLPDNAGDLGQHLRRAKRFASVSVLLSFFIAAVIYVAAPFLTFLVGEKFSESVTIVRWLVPVIPLLAISRAPLNGLLGLGKTTVRAATIISSAILSMVLYITLIESLSWRGAVVGTIVAELYITVLGWYLLVRYQRQADARDLERMADLEPIPVGLPSE